MSTRRSPALFLVSPFLFMNRRFGLAEAPNRRLRWCRPHVPLIALSELPIVTNLKVEFS
jgi:hypothetical protein